MTGAAPVRVLMVEDNKPDVRLTVEALRDTGVDTDLHVVADGVECLEILRGIPSRPTPFIPDLILLDLNLPRKGGQEVLADIKTDPALRHIPVVILTTSAADQDILASYRLGANAYVTKSVDLDGFLDSVRSLERFWLRAAKLPRHGMDSR